MSVPNIPLHLTLTGRPILLYPNVIPEMAAHLQNAYTARGSRLANFANRRKSKKAKAFTPLAAVTPSSRLALSTGRGLAAREPYAACISIAGPLLNKAEMMEGILCVDGYDHIHARMSAAMNDPDCTGILLDIDSPGGMVSGCFELHDKIVQMAKDKPIITHSQGMICSAAYALAAAGLEIHAQMSSVIGSIGVVYARVDVTEMNEKNGIKYTYIKSGDEKTWGNPDTVMSDEELVSHQSEVSMLAGWFHSRVAASRGMSVDVIQDLRAGTYLTELAVGHGIADSVTDFDGAFARLHEITNAPLSLSTSPPAEPASTEAATQQTAGGSVDGIPAPAPEPAAASTATAKPSTKKQETPMLKLTNARHRASLAVTLSAVAFAMAGNMAESTDLDDEKLKKAIEEETDETLDAMTDEDVAAMDDEDTEAMEDDENIEAMEDDEMKKVEDDDDSTTSDAVKATASSVARRAVAKASAAVTSAAPTESKSDDPVLAERARVSAIMALPEAKGREALAQTLATSAHGHSVDAARELLAATPKANARTFAPRQPKVGHGSASKKASAGDDLIAAAKAQAAKALG